jgi:hypothetical protein
VGRDHRLAHAHEARAEAVGAHALRGDAGAFQQKMQLVSEHVRLAEPGVAAELDQPRAVRALEIFDDTARRMILFREFDCGVGERTAALAGAGKM